MGWASQAIERLLKGETVTITPRGRSMEGRVEDGQQVTVHPTTSSELKEGDVVLCRVGASEYLHLVKEVGSDGRFLIGNNKGKTNGWVKGDQIFGRADV